MEKTGWVYLVGAGCGGADLITLRGMALLRNCDAVVYDDLISKELLDAVPPQAEKIYMGKRSGHHSAAQKEICAVLIRLAKEGKSVVRLKGGDPFIFGRGGEEALALQQAGVPCQVVPGISSAIAIPAWAGIPVTCRGVSQSYTSLPPIPRIRRMGCRPILTAWLPCREPWSFLWDFLVWSGSHAA